MGEKETNLDGFELGASVRGGVVAKDGAAEGDLLGAYDGATVGGWVGNCDGEWEGT